MRGIALLVAPLLMATPLVSAAPKTPPAVAAAVADPARSPEARGADATRKAAETLAFSGVRPGMVVGEFYPGGGYFTRMIAHVVGPRGHVYGVENDRWKQAFEEDKKLAASVNNVTMEAKAFGTVNFPKPLDLAWV